MTQDTDIALKFQFIGNRVDRFILETKRVDTRNQKRTVSYEFDYQIVEQKESEGKRIGILLFTVRARAKAGENVIVRLDLAMEGAFVGSAKELSVEQFTDLLESNGLTMISLISRAFILSATSQSGINPPVKLPIINVIALRDKKKAGKKKGKSLN